MDTQQLLHLTRARRLLSTGEGSRIRRAAGLSLREVAASIGVSPSTLCQWEQRRRTPRGEAGARYGELMATLERDLPTSAVPA